MTKVFLQSNRDNLSPTEVDRIESGSLYKFIFLHIIGFLFLAGTVDLSAQQVAPIRILAVGDSLCEGDDGEVTWRYYLERHLKDSNVTFVGRDARPRYNFDLGYEGFYGGGAWNKEHECIWGNTAQAELDPEDKVWIGERLQHHDPDYLLLMIGTNDLTLIGTNKHERDPYSSLSEQAFRRTENLVNAALANNDDVQIILGGIPPNAWFGYLEEGAELYANYNKKLARFAKSTHRVTYAETFWNPYLLATDTNGDGTHPTPTGYDKIAEQFASALAKHGVGDSTYDNRLSSSQPFFPRPRAPSSLKATPTSFGANLYWEAVSEAVDYHIYQSENGGPFNLVKYSIPTNQTTVRGLNPSAIYRYQVMAVVSGDITARSNIVSVRAYGQQETSLGGVTGVKVQPGVNSAYLTWDSIPEVVDYRVYLSENGTDYRIVNYNNTQPEALLGLLESGKRYYFKVDAIVGARLTEKSTPVSTVILNMPSRPILSSEPRDNYAQLSWTRVPNALGYEVQRMEGQSRWRSVYIGTSTTLAQFLLTTDASYHYRVRASLPFWRYTPWSQIETVTITSTIEEKEDEAGFVLLDPQALGLCLEAGATLIAGFKPSLQGCLWTHLDTNDVAFVTTEGILFAGVGLEHGVTGQLAWSNVQKLDDLSGTSRCFGLSAAFVYGGNIAFCQGTSAFSGSNRDVTYQRTVIAGVQGGVGGSVGMELPWAQVPITLTDENGIPYLSDLARHTLRIKILAAHGRYLELLR